MPTLETTHFQLLEYDTESVFFFPAGIPGFEEEKQFIFVEQPATKPLVFMQSMRQPALCFLALPVQVICPDYRLSVSAEDLQLLELPVGRQPVVGPDVLCLALLSVADNQPATANLLSPVVVNLRARKAVQAIQIDTQYSHRYPLAAKPEEALCS